MPNVQNILAELYAIDPGLRDHEAVLRPLLVQLAASRPDVTVDQKFARELRARLLETPVHVPVFQRVLNAIRVPAFATATVGVAALALLLSRNLASPSIPAVTVSKDASSAFGTLASIAPSSPTGMGGGGGEGVRTQSGGGAANLLSAVAPEGTMDAKMMIWNPIRYRYVYAGDTFEIKENTLPVYKRITRPISADALVSGLIPSIRGLFDLGSLKGLKLQNFSLVQETPFGYQLYVDLMGGNISLNANYTQWPRPDAACQDEACFAQYRLKLEDIPADAKVIAVAEAFLKEHGVSLADYGAPRVESAWRVQYAATTEPAQRYVPESIQVVYPLRIEGSDAVDESGNAAGLSISVNVRHMRVDNLWGLSANAFRSSEYIVEQDMNRLMSVLENYGGWPGAYPGDAKVVDVKVGTPSVVLMRSWLPSADGTSGEVFVPGLRFPVLEAPADQPWFSTSVMVPLPKEILDQRQQVPEIMPMLKAM